MKPKVDIVIPTVEGCCWPLLKWLKRNRSTYGEAFIEYQTEFLTDENLWRARYMNIAKNRNAAMKRALAGDADYFLVLDDDIVPPPQAIEWMLGVERPVVGGWYPLKGRLDRWVAGRFEADGNTFVACGYPRVVKPWESDRTAPFALEFWDPNRQVWFKQPFESDIAPCGCLLLERSVAELLPFRSGMELGERYYDAEVKVHGWLGECGAFGDDLWKIGERTAMSHRVVCQHIERKRK